MNLMYIDELVNSILGDYYMHIKKYNNKQI